MQAKEPIHDVVIVGGGFAGVRAALDLNHRLPKHIGITVIDRSSCHTPHPMFYEIASAVMPHLNKSDFLQVRGAVSLPFEWIFSGTRVRVVKGEFARVASFEKQVVLKDGRQFPYSRAVLALGSETNYFGVPGAVEKAHPAKSLDDALNVRCGIEELFACAPQGKPIRIVIAGAGFVGVEFAGELALLIPRLAVQYGHEPSVCTLALVGNGKEVLTGSRPWVSRRAEQRLKKLGVELVLGKPIAKYEANRVFFGDGTAMDADFLIWSAGIRPPTVLGDQNVVPRSDRGYAIANKFLQIEGTPDIYVAGDSVNSPIPATAQRAIAQGACVAKNISRSFASMPPVPYSPQQPAFIVPLGGKYAVADLWGVPVTGFIAWCLKMAVEFKYLASVVPLSRAVSLWFNGIRLYASND